MKKVYSFGDILITATYTNDFDYPNWDEKQVHPLYFITIREKGNRKRHTTKAWGNIANPPDTQHQSLAGIVLEEHLKEVGSFEDFCSEYGYDIDSRKAEKIWKQLEVCWNNGFWYDLVKDSHAFKLWETSGKDLEDLLNIEKR